MVIFNPATIRLPRQQKSKVPLWMYYVYRWLCVNEVKVDDIRVDSSDFVISISGVRINGFYELPTLEEALKDGRKLK